VSDRTNYFNEGVLAKILHITEALGGGIAHSVPLLMRKQAQVGHQLSLIYSRRDDTPTEEELDRLLPSPIQRKCIRMVRPISPREDWAALLRLRKELREHSPDVVHLHSSKAGALGRLASLGLGLAAKVFYSPRGLSFLNNELGTIPRTGYYLVEWLLCRLGGTLVAASASEREVLVRKLGAARVVVLENAVEIDELPVAMNLPRPPVQKLDIVTVGRISEQKAPWRFDKVAAGLHGQCNFFWLGDGPKGRRWLQEPSIHVSGWISSQEVRSRLAESDIFVLLSSYEGMPISLIEAQVAGLPAIVTNVVGNRDIVVDGENGYLVESPEEAIDRIIRLIENPGLRQKLGQKAREMAIKRFDSQLLAAASLRMYGLL
jgi:glycosyltransferase involved in cell wall biosynthesis